MRIALFGCITACAITATAVGQDSMTPEEVCLNQRIRYAAARVLGEWASHYPFARVIIGKDGQFGDISPPRSVEVGAEGITCNASYRLSRAGPNGNPYSVAIEDFSFRATDNGGGYNVSLVDYPQSIEGSGITSEQLLSRFSIDGRPYLEVLAENRRRIRQRGN